jgi:hypothetical protein
MRDYDALLSETFNGLRKLPPLNVAEGLFATEVFKNWRNHRDPRMLILHGSTVAPEHTELCWLSPAAVSVVDAFGDLFADDGTVLIKYFCKTTADPRLVWYLVQSWYRALYGKF